jgi:hypothetical protein
VSRPTDVEVGTTLQQLHQIATHDTDAHHLLAHLISLYNWLLEETHLSEHGRGFGHGANDVHVLAATSGDLEGRLRDPLLREQRRVKRRWLAGLREAGHRWADDAANVAKMADDWRQSG